MTTKRHDIAIRLLGMGWPTCTEGAEVILKLREQVADLENSLAKLGVSPDQPVESPDEHDD